MLYRWSWDFLNVVYNIGSIVLTPMRAVSIFYLAENQSLFVAICRRVIESNQL